MNMVPDLKIRRIPWSCRGSFSTIRQKVRILAMNVDVSAACLERSNRLAKLKQTRIGPASLAAQFATVRRLNWQRCLRASVYLQRTLGGRGAGHRSGVIDTVSF